MGIVADKVEDVFPLADFIADAIGTSAEVVVHDVADLETSVVYIRNGALSGRKVGDGTTDRALKLIHRRKECEKGYFANYEGRDLSGHRFRCSTCFIENRAGALIGLLCVNVNVTALDEAIDILTGIRNGMEEDWRGAAGGGSTDGSVAEGSRGEGSSQPILETLSGNPEDTIRKIVRTVLADFPVEPDRLSRQERLSALSRIYEEGAFYMKGAVQVVADELCVSVPTVYKYLQEVRSDSQQEQ